MDEERRDKREVISWEVMLVCVVMRRKSANHWGDAWRGDMGDSVGFWFEGDGTSAEDWFG